MQERIANPLIQFSLKYGLYIGLAWSLVLLLFSMSGKLHTNQDNSGVYYTIIIVVGMLFAGRKYQRDYFSNGITYGKALGFAVILNLFASGILGIFSYLFYSSINPDAVQLYINLVNSIYEQLSFLTNDQRELFLEIYRKPGMIAFASFFGQFINGVILALVVSFFIKSPLHLGNNRQN